MNKNIYRVISTNREVAYIQSKDNHKIKIYKSFVDSLVTNDLIQINADSKKNIIPRKNIFFRKEKKTKLIASNLDHIFLIISGYPNFSPWTLMCMLARAKNQNINVSIILNKDDLKESTELAKQELELLCPINFNLNKHSSVLDGWKKYGFGVIECSTFSSNGMDKIKQTIQKIQIQKPNDQSKSICFIGQSGVGKSSIMKKLMPNITVKISEISKILKSGKHTTTITNSYNYLVENKKKSDVWLIDTPGIENFGISDLKIDSIIDIFPDWKCLISNYGGCKFYNCRHIFEPNCGIKTLLKQYKKNFDTKLKHLEYRYNLWKKFMIKLDQ